MRTTHHRNTWRRLALWTVGATFFLGGCDPQIRSTVEDGIITLSTALLSSFLQAFLQLVGEANQQTAKLLTDLGPVFA